MSITDEMREWFVNKRWFGWGFEHTIEEMLDRIDAEHERAVRYERCAFWHDVSDDELSNYGLLRAPIDVDGVTWRIGDRDENGNIVMAIKLATDGFWVLVCCTDKLADKRGTYKLAKETRHYQLDTWEKIIEDALDADVDDFACMRDALVARCKALAGDNE